MDDNIKKAVKVADDATKANEYPQHPEEPKRGDKESNAAYGARLDVYENVLMPEYRLQIAAYRDRAEAIDKSFKADLLAALDLAKHPKKDILFRLAWEYGHSSGYHEVAIYADDLAELLI